MDNLLVFARIDDPLVQRVVWEAVTDQGFHLYSFRTYEDVLSAIQYGNVPNLLLLEPARLTSGEEELYASLIRCNSHIKPCLLVRPGENITAVRLARLEGACILTRPVLRSDVEALLENLGLTHRNSRIREGAA